MITSRVDKKIWSEWDGSGYSISYPYSTVYFIEDHINLDDEVVLKDLAITIQRDGISDSLSESYKFLGSLIETRGFAMYIDGDLSYTLVDESSYEDSESDVIPVTLVEVYHGN